MPRIRVNLSLVDSGTAAASATTGIAVAINQKQEGFELATSSGLVLASVISAVPILKPVTLQANTYAASVSILQLWLHVEDDAAPLTIASDVLNIVGSVSGIVAGGAFLLAAPGVLAGATIVAIAATVTNIFISSGAAEKLYDWSVGVIDTWAPPDGIPVSTENLFLDTSGVWREFFEIEEDPDADVAGIIIHHNDWASAQAYFVDENPAPPPPEPPKDEDPWENPEIIVMPPEALA